MLSRKHGCHNSGRLKTHFDKRRPHAPAVLLLRHSQVVSAVAASSPPHAAELLDGLAPYLTALALRLSLPLPGAGTGHATPVAPDQLQTRVQAGMAGPGAGAGDGGPGGVAVVGTGAVGLLVAVTARDAFAVEIVRLAQQLVVSGGWPGTREDCGRRPFRDPKKSRRPELKPAQPVKREEVWLVGAT